MVSYSGPLVKAALQAGATPITVAFLRMVFAGAFLLPGALKKSKGRKSSLKQVLSAPKKQLLWSVAAAAFLAFHYLTWMTSLNATSTFASVALVCTQPLFVAAFSGLVLHEPIPKKSRPGATLALVGALLIGANSLSGQGGDIGGDLLALAGAACMAGHWLCSRYARKTLPGTGYVCFVYLLTALFLGVMIPFAGGFILPAAAIPYIAGLVVGCTLLGHTLFTLALGTVSANVVSFALLGEPVGAMIWAILFFHEVPTPLLLAGGGVVLIGLCMYLYAGMSRANLGKTQAK